MVIKLISKDSEICEITFSKQKIMETDVFFLKASTQSEDECWYTCEMYKKDSTSTLTDFLKVIEKETGIKFYR